MVNEIHTNFKESRVFGWLTVSRRMYSIGYAGCIFSWLEEDGE